MPDQQEDETTSAQVDPLDERTDRELLQTLLREAVKTNANLALQRVEMRGLRDRVGTLESRLGTVEDKVDSTHRILEANSDLLVTVADAVLGPRKHKLNGK